MSVFSERLRALRMENGIKQAEIAAKLGVSVQSYSAYENGREPNYNILAKLSKLLGTSSDFLIGASDAKQPENSDVVERLGLTERTIKLLSDMNEVAVENYKDEPVSPLQIIDDFIANFADSDAVWRLCILCQTMLDAKEIGYREDAHADVSLTGGSLQKFHEARDVIENMGCVVVGGCEAVELARFSFSKALDAVITETIEMYENEYKIYLSLKEAKDFIYRLGSRINRVRDEKKKSMYADRFKEIANHAESTPVMDALEQLKSLYVEVSEALDTETKESDDPDGDD